MTSRVNGKVVWQVNAEVMAGIRSKRCEQFDGIATICLTVERAVITSVWDEVGWYVLEECLKRSKTVEQ